jgi:hypothetical protein
VDDTTVTRTWYLVRWPEHDAPYVLMEFKSVDEAVALLPESQVARSDAERQADRAEEDVCDGALMLSDPELREALSAWLRFTVELGEMERRALNDDAA